MRIAIINEVSSSNRNKDILCALEGRMLEVVNVGMTDSSDKPELLVAHTGLLAALLLNIGKVDFVIGGCGTGQGFLISAMQYPGVFCGLIQSPLDAWLFTQINGGNCISLALNQCYGWGGEINLRLIFDGLFKNKFCGGYPEHRKEPQALMRKKLTEISNIVHYPFSEIILKLDDEIIKPALNFPGILKLIDIENIKDSKLRQALLKRID